MINQGFVEKIQQNLGLYGVDFAGVVSKSNRFVSFAQPFSDECKKLVFYGVIVSVWNFFRNFFPMIFFGVVNA